MRRFSQRNSLVTLSDINITPLLDLAFVLLIIFVITTPLLEQSIKVTLPQGGRSDPPRLDRNSIRTVEIGLEGKYYLNKTAMSLTQIEVELIKAHRANPKMVVAIRADQDVPWKKVAAIWDICERNGIERLSAKTLPPTGK